MVAVLAELAHCSIEDDIEILKIIVIFALSIVSPDYNVNCSQNTGDGYGGKHHYLTPSSGANNIIFQKILKNYFQRPLINVDERSGWFVVK